LAQLWTRLLEAVGRVSGFTRSYLVEGHPVSFAKNLFTIGFDPEFADRIGLVDNVKNHTLLQAKLAELGFPQVQFKFVQAEAPAARPAPATPPAPPSETPPPRAKEQEAGGAFAPAKFKDDPLIQKALEVFKGRIAEIRA
jgi:hypothetical protein